MPDYPGLVRFLIEPFLESTASISIDCETSENAARVWIRIAFEGEDKGRVFGRGGRNIQAIKTLVAAAAACAGHSAYLDVYGSSPSNSFEGEIGERENSPRAREPQRESAPKPAIKLRPRLNLDGDS
ncbi:KH domain-containing protein [Synechocystis sp. PCC 7509]|uniref:KH domain-containing protein n=1 Tax=Synechocystis sp. PCC 7509 TaxID=927677 RepID=UPI0002ABC35A|nr:KH domain-containing protein [Synechocystis sp. PCC 7509]